jgi:hypothetical protein
MQRAVPNFTAGYTQNLARTLKLQAAEFLLKVCKVGAHNLLLKHIIYE